MCQHTSAEAIKRHEYMVYAYFKRIQKASRRQLQTSREGRLHLRQPPDNLRVLVKNHVTIVHLAGGVNGWGKLIQVNSKHVLIVCTTGSRANEPTRDAGQHTCRD